MDEQTDEDTQHLVMDEDKLANTGKTEYVHKPFVPARDQDWQKPLIFDWAGKNGPPFTKEDFENCAIEYNLQENYCPPWGDPDNPETWTDHPPDDDPPRTKRKIKQYPRLSSLTHRQHQLGLKFLIKYGDKLPTHVEALQFFEEIKELYEEEQNEYREWARQLWIEGDFKNKLTPIPVVETVYEAQFKLMKNKITTFSINDDFTTIGYLPLQGRPGAYEFQHIQDLESVDVQELPHIRFPDNYEQSYRHWEAYGVPKACPQHPCNFKLPHENKVTSLPLRKIHIELARFASENDIELIASENALQCLVDTDRRWKLPVSVVAATDSDDSGMKTVVVIGSEFSLQKACGAQRTQDSFRQLLRYIFTKDPEEFGGSEEEEEEEDEEDEEEEDEEDAEDKVDEGETPINVNEQRLRSPKSSGASFYHQSNSKAPSESDVSSCSSEPKLRVVVDEASVPDKQECNQTEVEVRKQMFAEYFGSDSDEDSASKTDAEIEVPHEEQKKNNFGSDFNDDSVSQADFRADDDVVETSYPPCAHNIIFSSSDERTAPIVDVENENEGPTFASARNPDAQAYEEQKENNFGSDFNDDSASQADFRADDDVIERSYPPCAHNIICSSSDERTAPLVDVENENEGPTFASARNPDAQAYEEQKENNFGSDFNDDSASQADFRADDDVVERSYPPCAHNIICSSSDERTAPLVDVENENEGPTFASARNPDAQAYEEQKENNFGSDFNDDSASQADFRADDDAVERSYPPCAHNIICSSSDERTAPLVDVENKNEDPTFASARNPDAQANEEQKENNFGSDEESASEELSKTDFRADDDAKRSHPHCCHINFASSDERTAPFVDVEKENEGPTFASARNPDAQAYEEQKENNFGSDFNASEELSQAYISSDDDVVEISSPPRSIIDLCSSDEGTTPFVDVEKQNEDPTFASTRNPDAQAYEEQKENNFGSDEESASRELSQAEFRADDDVVERSCPHFPHIVFSSSDKQTAPLVDFENKNECPTFASARNLDAQANEEQNENNFGSDEESASEELSKADFRADDDVERSYPHCCHINSASSDERTALLVDVEKENEGPTFASARNPDAQAYEEQKENNFGSDFKASEELSQAYISSDDDVVVISSPPRSSIDLCSSEEETTPIVDVEKQNEVPTFASARNPDAQAYEEQNEENFAGEYEDTDTIQTRNQSVLDTATLPTTAEKNSNFIEGISCTCAMNEKPFPRSIKKWHLKSTSSGFRYNILIHASHKTRDGKKEVILEPIVEWQPDLGACEQPEGRLRALALALTMRPNAELVNVRMDCNTGDVIMINKLNEEQFIELHGDRRSEIVYTIHTIITRLLGLKAGEYVLAHDADKCQANICAISNTRKVAGNSRDSFSMDFKNVNLSDGELKTLAEIPPTFSGALMPYNIDQKMLPLAFSPDKRRVEGYKKKRKSKRGKKKMRPEQIPEDVHKCG